MAKIELTVEPSSGKVVTTELPDDWFDLSAQDQQEYLKDEAAELVLSTVKYHGKVVE